MGNLKLIVKMKKTVYVKWTIRNLYHILKRIVIWTPILGHTYEGVVQSFHT